MRPIPIRVLVVDDHPLVRMGIRSMLTPFDDIQVVADLATATCMLREWGRLNPDVVILDLKLPDMDGLTALQHLKLRHDDASVLVFTGYDHPRYISRAMQLGACGYLLKTSDAAQLACGIRQLSRGQELWPDELMRIALPAMADLSQNNNSDVYLTEREGFVLDRITAGKANKEIAKELTVSTACVKEEVQSLIRKIGVADRTQAAVWAVRERLV